MHRNRHAGDEAKGSLRLLDAGVCAAQLVVYCALLSLGIHALHDQPWLIDSAQFWRDWPSEALPCAPRLALLSSLSLILT